MNSRWATDYTKETASEWKTEEINKYFAQFIIDPYHTGTTIKTALGSMMQAGSTQMMEGRNYSGNCLPNRLNK